MSKFFVCLEKYDQANWQIGLEGEFHRIFNPDSRDDIKWMPSPEPPKDQPLIWYKVTYSF